MSTRSLGVTLGVKKQNDEKIKAVIRTASKYWRESDNSETKKAEELRIDVKNSWKHVWGDHTSCRSSYCNGQASQSRNYVNIMPDSVKSKFEWAVQRCADLSHDLIKNMNNNFAEAPNNAIVSSWGSKRIDTSQSNALESRAMCAVLRFNDGQPYTDIAKAMGKRPSPIAQILESHYREKKYRRQEKIRRDKEDGTHIARRLQRTRLPACTNDYGMSAEQPDLPPDVMQEKIDLHFEKLKEWQDERVQIERRTVLQSECPEWYLKRGELLTASLYGKVCKRRPGTSCRTIVKQILYQSDNSKVKALRYGRENEKNARARFLELERQKNPEADVVACGLFLDPEIVGLGATPDDLYGEDAIVEYKCPISAEQLGIVHALSVKGSPVSKMFSKCKTKLKKSHDYYYQIQGQLRATGRKWCYFFLWSPIDQKCVKVERCSDTEWNVIAGKLEQFYRYCIAPEIVHPRGADRIRDPDFITQYQKSATDQSQQDAAMVSQPISQCSTMLSEPEDMDIVASGQLSTAQIDEQHHSDDDLSDWDELMRASQNYYDSVFD